MQPEAGQNDASTTAPTLELIQPAGMQPAVVHHGRQRLIWP